MRPVFYGPVLRRARGGEAAVGRGLCGVGAQKGGKREKIFNAVLDGGGQGFLIIWFLGDGVRRLQLMETHGNSKFQNSHFIVG